MNIVNLLMQELTILVFLFSVFFQIVKQLFQLLSVYMWKEPLAERNHEETSEKHKGVRQQDHLINTMNLKDFSLYYTSCYIHVVILYKQYIKL